MPVQKVFNGTDWVSVDGGGGVSGDYIEGEGISKIYVSGTQPTGAESGDLWLDTNSQSASGIAYLPLSAGSNFPITGDLLFNSNGTDVGQILLFDRSQYTISGVKLETLDSNGDVVAGTSSNDLGQSFLYGTDGIYLRPAGANDNTKQVLINTSGEIIGKRKVDAASSGVISQTVTSAASYVPKTFDRPTGCQYALQNAQFAFTSTTSQMIAVVVNGNSNYTYVTGSNTTRYLTIIGLTDGNAACSIKPESANITVSSWIFRVMWF